MNEQMDDRQTDGQSERQILRKQLTLWSLTLGRQLDSWELLLVSLLYLGESLLQEALVLAVESSTAWTRPTCTKLSPASSRIHS